MTSKGTRRGQGGGRDVRIRSKRLDQIDPSLIALAAWMAAREEIERRTGRSLGDGAAAQDGRSSVSPSPRGRAA